MNNSADLLLERLRKAFAEHGTIADFCKVTGISRNAVTGWLTGKNVPTLPIIDRIAEYFGVSPADLLDKEVRVQPPELADPRREADIIVEEILQAVARIPRQVLVYLTEIDWKKVKRLRDVSDLLEATLGSLPRRNASDESSEEEAG